MQVGAARAVAMDKVQLLLVELSKFRERHPSLDGEILGSELLGWLYYLTNGYRDRKERASSEDSFPTLAASAGRMGRNG